MVMLKVMSLMTQFFFIPHERIKRNKKKRNQAITGKGGSTGNVMGTPEPVRHLFVKRISKDTNDEDVFTMMEQNGFFFKTYRAKSSDHWERRFNWKYNGCTMQSQFAIYL